MRWLTTTLLWGLLLFVGRDDLTPFAFAQPIQSRRPMDDALRRDIERARDRVFPALVNILTVTRYYEGGRAQYGLSGGSGVIVTPGGIVLTNYHVAENAVRIFCTLGTGERFEARVVAHDPLTDLSILQIQLTEGKSLPSPTLSHGKGAGREKVSKAKGSPARRTLPYAPLGDSDTVKTGDYVLAMGNPLLLSSSVTLGIVSNPRRVFTDVVGSRIEAVEFEKGDRSGMLTRWIQHDALILPGNSGGPLVNLRGEVIGINQLGGRGVGFAIPSNIARTVLRQVLRTGKIERGWIGISVLPVEKLGRQTGALISSVTPESPAERVGLKPGDILLRLDGKPVRARFMEEIPLVYQQIAELPVGKQVVVEIERQGKRQRISLTVARMEPYYGKEMEFRELGFTARDITRPFAYAYKLPKQGVYITGIRPGYPLDSAEPSLSAGDVILKVGDRPVCNLSELQAALATFKGKELIPITFQRKEEIIVSAVRNKPPSEPSPSAELPKPWLGVRTQVITRQVAESLGKPNLKGFRITEVLPWSEASKAGLQVGDLIVALNDEPLEASRVQDARDLERRIEQLTIGEQAKLTVLRGDQRLDILVKLEPTPASAQTSRTVRQKELEFAVRDVTPLDRMRNRWSQDQTGVIVTEVANGSWAQLGGLRLNDLILAINEQPIRDTKAFQQVMEQILTQRPPIIILFVRRDNDTHFVFLEPDWKQLNP
ncbi:MAG: PDZ domain-containing protein [Armatimonadota bacterium]